MATSFKHAVNTGLGTTPVDVLTADEGFRLTVIGCNVANVTDYDTVIVNVWVVDASSTAAYYVRGIPVPPNTSLKIITNGEKLILPEGATLRIAADIDNSLDTVISYVEIS